MKSSKSTNKKSVLMVVNIVALLALGGAAGYFWNENRDLKDQASLTTEQRNERLISEINEVFELPQETPVVAVVTDPEQFKSEYPTFDGSQEGDYLLFFRKARLNVLYRQSEKKVVQTADVVLPLSVELFGSQSAIDDAQSKLSEFGNQISVTSTVLDGVTESFVFDVDSDQANQAQTIAQQLDINLGSTLPSTIEAGTQTEIVIALAGGTTTSSPEQSLESSEPTTEQLP